nr:hypothetical protein DSAG12_00370 [Candidatus Prometheoarchaeum syntrophicum]
MLSKEEAENKLLKIFYDVKLNETREKEPTKAKIADFEETIEHDDLDHYLDIQDDVLKIGIHANSYEHGIPYIAVQMAGDSAIDWKDKYNYNKFNPILITEGIIVFLVFFVAGILEKFSIYAIGLFLIIAETVGFIYFIVQYIKWNKRIVIRFHEFFKNTGIFLPEETIKKYSKLALKNGFVKINHFFQYFIAFLLIGTWISFLTTVL